MPSENCRHMLADLSDYLDGEASEALCAEIERQMTGCEECRIVVDTLGKTIFLYRELPRPEMNEDARRRLYQSLDLQEYLK
jgi:anti-sigma factor RsiW